MKNESFLSTNVKETFHYFFAYFLIDFESWASLRIWAWVLMDSPFFKHSLKILHKWTMHIAKNNTNKLPCDEHQAKVHILRVKRQIDTLKKVLQNHQ